MNWCGGRDRPPTVEAHVPSNVSETVFGESAETMDFWLPAGTYDLLEVWYPRRSADQAWVKGI